MKKLNIGIVGATGVVGTAFLDMLESRSFPVQDLRLFASEQSVGQKVIAMKRETSLQALKENCFAGLDLVFFSSGDQISAEWAPQAVKSGAYVVDNSAAFRMVKGTPLIVPEVNGRDLNKSIGPQIIANPNCSTIQLVVALFPLLDFGLTEVRVASYQAVSGAGKEGIKELDEQLGLTQTELREHKPNVFTRPIASNCVPAIGAFDQEGFSSEENKIRLETKKILNLPHLRVSAFTVRIPVRNCHSECVWMTFAKDPGREAIVDALKNANGVHSVLTNSAAKQDFVTALEADGKDATYVGRLRKEPDFENTYSFWVVSDNLRKGAALNGIQIAEELHRYEHF